MAQASLRSPSPATCSPGGPDPPPDRQECQQHQRHASALRWHSLAPTVRADQQSHLDH